MLVILRGVERQPKGEKVKNHLTDEELEKFRKIKGVRVAYDGRFIEVEIRNEELEDLILEYLRGK